MEFERLPLTTLCLVMTHQCSSSCPNCGFMCSPRIKERMTIDEALHYIDKSLELFPSLKCLVLTGGEVSLYKLQELNKVISYAKAKGLPHIRIVTNGVWASSLEMATDYLSKLIESGLTELNISTGDEHTQFVPIDHVLNAVMAAKKMGIYVSIALEKHKGENNITIDKLEEEYNRLFGKSRDFEITVSNWIEVKKLQRKYMESDFESQKKIHPGCTNLFTGIQINPHGQLLACCGFAAEFSNHLKLGHIDSYATREQYENNLYNLITIWLYSEGPKGIVEYLENKGLRENDSVHTCEHCLRLLLNSQYIEEIKKVSSGKMKEIILRYEATRNQHQLSLKEQFEKYDKN